MRKLICLLLIIAGVMYAETPSSIYAAGISYNPSASPSIAGTALYAKKATESTYAFTIVDALPTTLEPFVVTTQVGGGIAQRVLTLGGVGLYIPGSVSLSYSSTNVGWGYSTGGMAIISLKDNWRLMPNVRVMKSSISNGTGYQLIVGTLIGWGK